MSTAMKYKTRRRLSILLLLVWLPLYMVVAVTVMTTIERPPLAIELLIYAVLGIAWALPFRSVFRGVGQADPEGGTDAEPK